jgi:hypothetical protein
MPTLLELRRRFGSKHEAEANPAGTDESLITDCRGRLTPAQFVEQKLQGLLPVPNSRGSGPRGGSTLFERAKP